MLFETIYVKIVIRKRDFSGIEKLASDELDQDVESDSAGTQIRDILNGASIRFNIIHQTMAHHNLPSRVFDGRHE